MCEVTIEILVTGAVHYEHNGLFVGYAWAMLYAVHYEHNGLFVGSFVLVFSHTSSCLL